MGRLLSRSSCLLKSPAVPEFAGPSTHLPLPHTAEASSQVELPAGRSRECLLLSRGGSRSAHLRLNHLQASLRSMTKPWQPETTLLSQTRADYCHNKHRAIDEVLIEDLDS